MKKNNKILLKLMLIIFLFSSCKYDKAPISPESGVIKGEIVDALSGPTNSIYLPLSDVLVRTEPQSKTAYTYADGNFYMSNILPGHYILSAERDGYYINRIGVEVHSRQAAKVDIVLYQFNKDNSPPIIPNDPIPRDKSGLFLNYTTLNWACSDPDEDLIFYSIYLSVSNPPTQILAFEIANPYFDVTGLDPATTYYWKVIARDWFGASSISDIWSFTTK